MATTLRELRENAGYRTALDFARKIGISKTSYSRYEADPQNITMGAARVIADELGCSIDAVVGREPVPEGAMRGDVQKTYDALSPQGKALVDEFLEFAAAKDAAARRTREDAAAREYEHMARHYERQFYLENGDEDALVFGTAEDLRRMYRGFLEGKARARAEIAVDDALVDRETEMLKDAKLLVVDDDGARATGLEDPEAERLIAAELDRLKRELAEDLKRKNADRIEKIMAAYDRIHAADYGKDDIEYGIVEF